MSETKASILSSSLDCILAKTFFFPSSDITSITTPLIASLSSSSHPVDQAACLYLSERPSEALALLHAFREDTARDPLGAGVDRQLQAMLGSISAYLVLGEYATAASLILRTSAVVESILVGRDRRKHFSVSITLLSLGLLTFFHHHDRKLVDWLISDSNLILFRRSAPHLLPLVDFVFFFSVSVTSRLPSAGLATSTCPVIRRKLPEIQAAHKNSLAIIHSLTTTSTTTLH